MARRHSVRRRASRTPEGDARGGGARTKSGRDSTTHQTSCIVLPRSITATPSARPADTGAGIGTPIVPAMTGSTAASRPARSRGPRARPGPPAARRVVGIAILAVVLQQQAAGRVTAPGLAEAFGATFSWALGFIARGLVPTLRLPRGRSDGQSAASQPCLSTAPAPGDLRHLADTNRAEVATVRVRPPAQAAPRSRQTCAPKTSTTSRSPSRPCALPMNASACRRLRQAPGAE